MDEKPRANANLDHDETNTAAVSGPLGKLVERESRSGSVEVDTPDSIAPAQPSSRSVEYAEGTTEHDDDHEE